MAEPSKQIEIQLGHLCNNRCVFCVSGQMSERKMAGQVPTEPVLEELRSAREKGFERVTFLGGEPTIQRSFLEALRTATELDFPEIVIFTNGVMASKERFLDRVLAIGDFTWRFSIQGATARHHDAVTKNEGSFDRILRAIELLGERGQKITANMCITTDNLESLPAYPALVQTTGVQQLHLDMVRPLDAGDRDDSYLESILPRYTDMKVPISNMLEAFDPEFDVNIGNYPYCLLPDWAHRIHHDGEWTLTVAADGNNQLEPGWDKYAVKRRDKSHPPACEACVFRSKCNGLFDKYQEIHGVDEPQTVTHKDLLARDKENHFFVLLMEKTLAHLSNLRVSPPWRDLHIHRNQDEKTVHLIAKGDETPALKCSLYPAGFLKNPDAQTTLFDFRIEEGLAFDPPRSAEQSLRIFEALCNSEHVEVLTPPDHRIWIRRGQAEQRVLRHVTSLLRFAQAENIEDPTVVQTPDGIRIRFSLSEGESIAFVLKTPEEEGDRVGFSYEVDANVPSETHRTFISKAVEAMRSERPSPAP